MTFTREQVSFMQERIQAWCVNSPHTITKGDVYSLLTDARLEVEEKPKYDPCRLFKKGDRVQVKKRNGRCNGKKGEYLREAFCEVAEDEVPNELVRVYHNSSEYLLDPAYLELVTPVEELGPYRVDHNQYGWHVEKDGEILATYNDERHPHSKEAAEAECARLNAEHRKEEKCQNG